MTSIVVDDTSPWLTYVGTWPTGNITTDEWVDLYYNHTYHTSDTDGNYAVFQWIGSDAVFYGAVRNNHGWYSASLDGGPATFYSGYVDTGTFQTTIFNATGLDWGEHQVILTNQASYQAYGATNVGYFDLDYIRVIGTPTFFSTTATPTGSVIPADIPTVLADAAIITTISPSASTSHSSLSAATSYTTLASASQTKTGGSTSSSTTSYRGGASSATVRASTASATVPPSADGVVLATDGAATPVLSTGSSEVTASSAVLSAAGKAGSINGSVAGLMGLLWLFWVSYPLCRSR